MMQRLKRILVSGQLMLDLLNGNLPDRPAYNSGQVIPGDAEIVDVKFKGNDTLELWIWSTSFDETETENLLPELRPEFTSL